MTPTRAPRGQNEGSSGFSNSHPPSQVSREAAAAPPARQGGEGRWFLRGRNTWDEAQLRRSGWTSTRNWGKRPELLPAWIEGKTDTGEVPVQTTGEPVLGSRGLSSKSKPNLKPGVLRRRHVAPKQHFLCQYQCWGQGKKPLRVSSAQGHLQIALHMHSSLATCQSPSAHCPFLTGSCPHGGSRQTRVLPGQTLPARA